jgi:hypothetical protein
MIPTTMMGAAFNDIVNLISVLVWPTVVVIGVLVFRRHLPALAEALSHRVSRFSFAGLSLEFSLAQPLPEELRTRLDAVREPTSAGPPPPSAIPSLLQLASSAGPADYLTIDLGEGRSWLTSRLYLFATVLPQVSSLRCFVFVGPREHIPDYFVGLSEPRPVAEVLESRFVWLREAMAEAQLLPVVRRSGTEKWIGWHPSREDQSKLSALKSALDPKKTLDMHAAAPLQLLVSSLVQPPVLEPGGNVVEELVSRFLNSERIRRRDPSPDPEWVSVGDEFEHARWLKGEADLVSILSRDVVRRPAIQLDPKEDEGELSKAVLRTQGSFVAATDRGGRFLRLIDRQALLEKYAAEIAARD